MWDAEKNLFTRGDTILGVCQGLGEDMGFNPLWLRIVLTLALFFYPAITIGGYLVLAMAVLGSRLLFPAAKPAMEGASLRLER